MSEAITKLLSTPVAEWTPDHEAQLTEAVCTAVIEAATRGEVVWVSIPCTEAPVVAHYTKICEQMQASNSDVILTAGRTWKNKQVLEWTFEGYSEKRKANIAKVKGLIAEMLAAQARAEALAIAVAVAKLKAESQIQAQAEAKVQGQ